MKTKCFYCTFRFYGAKLFWKVLKHKKIIKSSECCPDCMSLFMEAAAKYSTFYCNHCGKRITPHNHYSEQYKGYYCHECTVSYNEFLNFKNKDKKMFNKNNDQIMWENDMVKFLKITHEEAHKIAENRYRAWKKELLENEAKQKYIFYADREKYISKLKARNVFEKIKSVEHAQHLRYSDFRHNCTNYDKYLQEGYNKIAMGFLPHGGAKDYAIQKMYEDLKMKKSA